MTPDPTPPPQPHDDRAPRALRRGADRVKSAYNDSKAWLLGLGLAEVGLGVAIGFLLGAGLVYAAHARHWIDSPDTRQVAAFSEVKAERAGELAQRFRPWLKFDTHEEWRPLNVASVFAEKRNGLPAHRFCERPGRRGDCTPISGLTDFEMETRKATSHASATFVDLAGEKAPDYRGPEACDGLADCGRGPTSAIYYHVTKSNDRFYVDYWWFLRFNNFYRSVPGLSCRSASLAAQGVCDQHEGDWEGVTVVTPPAADDKIDYVVYAIHKGTFRYSAGAFGHSHGENHPDVFVARGSHASYAIPCPSKLSGVTDPKKCTQPPSLAAQGLLTLPESSYDGKTDWERNADDCPAGDSGSCLLPLPRTDNEATTWTAWPGQWGGGCGKPCGSKRVFNSPASPGLQGRYQTPWCSTLTQSNSFTCDGKTLGCSDWLGPLVVTVVCDPHLLAEGLRDPKKAKPGTATITVKGEGRKRETTPGVVQALGDPLRRHDRVTITGASATAEILVRAQQGQNLVELRFNKLTAQERHRAVITVENGTDEPIVRLGNHRPVERRVLELD